MTAAPAMAGRTGSAWLGGCAFSVLAHGAVLVLVLLNVRPRPLPPQSMPQTRIAVTTYRVPNSVAAAEPATGARVRDRSAAGATVSGAVIAQSRAKTMSLPSLSVSVRQPSGTKVKASSGKGDAFAAVAPALVPVAAETLPGQAPTRPILPAAPFVAVTALPAAPPQHPVSLISVPAAAVRPDSTSEAAVRPAGTVMLAATAPAGRTPSPAVLPQQTPQRAAAGAAALSVPMPATGTLLATASSDGAPVPAVPLPADHLTAALAWAGGGGVVDPVSLSAIQAFMTPGNLAASADNAGKVRDGIAALLAAVPCARLQTVFVPETGTLELRGHVPEAGLRAPILAALQQEVGASIPVADKLRVLPHPQCNVLAGIAAIGLPQSTDQQTDPRVIGPGTYVRDYSFVAGQKLALDLTAPDYASVIYVDYFDAAGNVIHLQPNSMVPLARMPAKAHLSVGKKGPNRPGLNITIGPPYGLEIAVAFATSRPLYEAVRPMVEPAGPYLAFLRAKVARARRANPDFKGEWAYFLISTAAR